MNILIENGNVNPPFTEGTANILLTHAKELVRLGHRVTILTREKSIVTKKKYPRIQEEDGLKFYRWSNYLDLFFLYKKILKKEGINVIHIFSKGLRPLSYIRFLKRAKIPLVFSSIGLPETEKGYSEKRLREFLSLIDVFVMTSKYVFDKTPALRRRNCFYLPYGIDLTKFKKRAPTRPKKEMTFVAYLRSPPKELLKGFGEILSKSQKIGFVFNKKYVQKNPFLKEFVLNNEKRISLLSELKDISNLFNNVGVVVDTHSKNRYLECASPPLLLLEAMACETKVVSTKMGEIEEFISNEKNGFLVEENSPDKIALVIKRALEAGNEINRAARRTISDKYDIRKVIKDYLNLYLSIEKGVLPLFSGR